MDADGSITDAEIATPRFYDWVRADAQTGPVFAGAIDNWPPHVGFPSSNSRHDERAAGATTASPSVGE